MTKLRQTVANFLYFSWSYFFSFGYFTLRKFMLSDELSLQS